MGGGGGGGGGRGAKEKRIDAVLFGQGFFWGGETCLLLLAAPSISMPLFLRVTTPTLAKSREKQGDTSPFQMCCYNRISLMGVLREQERREGWGRVWLI